VQCTRYIAFPVPIVNFPDAIFKRHSATVRASGKVTIDESIINCRIFARIFGKLPLVSSDSDFEPSLRMMRYKTSQTLITERPNESRPIKLMQPRSLQPRRVSNIMSITCRHQNIAITTLQ
jgi:hypothetical protein